MKVQTQLPLYHNFCDSWEINTLETDPMKAALVASPIPQLNITLWSLYDYQLPKASYTHSSVFSGSLVEPMVMRATNSHHTGGWGAEVEGI